MLKEYEVYSIEEVRGIIAKRLDKRDFAWMDIASGNYDISIVAYYNRKDFERDGFWTQGGYLLVVSLDGALAESPSTHPFDYDMLQHTERFMKESPVKIEIQFLGGGLGRERA